MRTKPRLVAYRQPRMSCACASPPERGGEAQQQTYTLGRGVPQDHQATPTRSS